MSDNRYTIKEGNSLEVLAAMDKQSVDCVVTSPPYWGLRDYGSDGQIGLEETPEEYVANMVEVFREVRRVLRDHGTLWLNLGDSYAGGSSGGTKTQGNPEFNKNRPSIEATKIPPRVRPTNLKPKDLCGIPWRVAFALQADGWWLRQDIIWHKPNPMPESITDRCTKAHEYVFLLTKSQRYHYDADAIKEDAVTTPAIRDKNAEGYQADYTRGDRFSAGARMFGSADGKRNKQSVWRVPTKPFPGAHFAVYPEALIRPCVLAGCAEGGTVLDPFSGSGTTGIVALKNARRYIGIEINHEYAALSRKRIDTAAPISLWEQP